MFRRILNLWRLSKVDVPKGKPLEVVKIIKDILEPHAKIVSMENPIEKLKLD